MYFRRSVTTALTNTATILLLTVYARAGTIRFVDSEAEGSNTGVNWKDAFRDLQDALDDARAGDEIWVASGVYRPDGGTGDPAATFQLLNNVEIYGGFAGHESDLDARDPKANLTTLSGDWPGPNAHHVVTGSLTNASAVLDGFVVTRGVASSPPNQNGGGMYNWRGSPTVVNCVFFDNWGVGAGVYNEDCSPTFIGCAFVKNTAQSGNPGGGMFNLAITDESTPLLINCLFAGNVAGGWGGGMYNAGNQCNATLVNCIFSGNWARRGGGIYVHQGQATVANCVFSGNHAAEEGGGIYGGGYLVNSILWGNSDANGTTALSQVSVPASVSFSCVMGGWSGGTNTGADPFFMDHDGIDDVVGTLDDNLRLSFGSPCIDAGHNSLVPVDVRDLNQDGNTDERTPIDADGNPRFNDDPHVPDCSQGPPNCSAPPVVDMGAYEYTAGIYCLQNFHCDDGDSCTSDVCIERACTFAPIDAVAPTVMHGLGLTGDTRPFTGYVDPRAESTTGEFANLGLDEVVFVFDEPVRAVGGGALSPASFVVNTTGGEPTSIVAVDDTANPIVALTLASPPPLSEWTTITAVVEDLCGNPIESLGNLGPGIEEPDRIDFLFLPGDVDQSSRVDPFDLLRFRQIVADAFTPALGVPEDFVDLNRTGEVTPFDLLMFRQLIAGQLPATRPWSGETANHPQP